MGGGGRGGTDELGGPDTDRGFPGPKPPGTTGGAPGGPEGREGGGSEGTKSDENGSMISPD